jgi:hypothetical protein
MTDCTTMTVVVVVVVVVLFLVDATAGKTTLAH